jgi:hypothetical protein
MPTFGLGLAPPCNTSRQQHQLLQKVFSISKKEEDFEFKRHECSIEKKNSSEVEKLLFLPCTYIQITPPFLMNIRLNAKFILTFLTSPRIYI